MFPSVVNLSVEMEGSEVTSSVTKFLACVPGLGGGVTQANDIKPCVLHSLILSPWFVALALTWNRENL